MDVAARPVPTVNTAYREAQLVKFKNRARKSRFGCAPSSRWIARGSLSFGHTTAARHRSVAAQRMSLVPCAAKHRAVAAEGGGGCVCVVGAAAPAEAVRWWSRGAGRSARWRMFATSHTYVELSGPTLCLRVCPRQKGVFVRSRHFTACTRRARLQGLTGYTFYMSKPDATRVRRRC